MATRGRTLFKREKEFSEDSSSGKGKAARRQPRYGKVYGLDRLGLQRTGIILCRDIIGLPVCPCLSFCKDLDCDTTPLHTDDAKRCSALWVCELAAYFFSEVAKADRGRELVATLRANDVR